jgi:alkylhydroperoxidase/carboxymuconolactone decarboxylase family protein YurZ
MSQEKAPSIFRSLKQSHPNFIDAVDRLGQAVREQGPLDNKTTHLVQLAAAAAIRSEGAVHSHVRRALEAGASIEEVRHALMLLTSTIGFPTVVAALSWVEDVLGQD